MTESPLAIPSGLTNGLQFRDIAEFGLSQNKTQIRYVEIAPGSAAIPKATRFIFGPATSATTEAMFSPLNTGSAGYYSVSNAVVTHDNIVAHRGTILTSIHTNHPDYHCRALLGSVDPSVFAREPRRVQGTGALLTGPGWKTWGHWLVDFLPRFYLLHLAGWDVFQLRWIMPSGTLPFSRDLLALLGIPQDAIVEFEAAAETLAFDEVLMPMNLTAGALMHPLFTDSLKWMLRRMKLTAAEQTGSERKIFVSRRSNPHHRELLNRDEIEATAASFGYTVVDPAPLVVADQIALFHGATHIAGEYGSGLHSSIFAPPGAVLTCLRGPNHSAGVLQNGLAKACRQDIGYVFGESVSGDQRQAYSINTKLFELALRCADMAWRENTGNGV